MLGAFVVMLALCYSWSRIQIVQVGYEINDLVHEQKNYENENKNLKMELLFMKSPQRITKYVTEKIDMQPPSGDRIVDLTSK